jgi:UDP-N-acetylglucosamine--N-acetylmuramyl-(pentapeptide) pyrophosphoryl-undecaprenol N-acetylglucosamine transferase
MTTILFAGGGSGGHLFPALAVANAVAELHPDWQLAFAGSERGVEASVLPGRGLTHRLFPFEPIHRRAWWRNYRWPFLARRIVREVDMWLEELQPAAVVGTGGYVSGPLVWRAASKGIPTGILELDVLPGLATRLGARYATEIWLATDEARARLPKRFQHLAVTTGAPIAPPDPIRRDTAMARFGLTSDKPVIMVTGGSQGSVALNQVVGSWLSNGGGEGRQVIWATGQGSYQEFAHHHSPPNVHAISFIDPMADAWAVADMAITRGGMMTLSELAAWGIPSILVPLPSSAADHQRHNAEAAAAAGAAIHLPQSELTEARLESLVQGLIAGESSRASMASAALARGRPDAAGVIATHVVGLVGE